MGIERFIRTINNNKLISQNITVDDINNNFIYLDFNALIHNTIEEIESELNYILYEIIIQKEFDASSNLIINKYYNILNLTETNNLDLNYFKTEIVAKTDKILLEIVKTKIKLFITDKTEYLYIAFDGIPTMTKIVEQRKRRYISYILNKIKSHLFDKHKDTFDDNRIMYKNNYVTIDRTEFIKNIYSNIDQVKLIFNVKNINISSNKIHGEGEKKIFTDILTRKQSGEYLIFSPDADVIVLSLLALNKLDNSSIRVCRNYQIDNKDIININILRNNIIKYVGDKINYETTNTKTILNDICFLITFMGNDFLPAIYSFKNKSSLSVLIDIYCDYLNKDKYLTYNKNNKTLLNYNNFCNLLGLLSKLEYKLIIEKYASITYKNFGYINFIMDLNTDNILFLDKLYYYVIL